MAEVEKAPLAPVHSSSPAVVAAPPPPPPPQRRPRVREVGSRFMSPVASSSVSGDLHKSPHHKQQRLRRHQDNNNNKEMESMSSADENRPIPIETARSLESPFHFHSGKEALQRKHQNQRSVMKLFNEHGHGGPKFSGRSRPDTPTFMSSSLSSSSSRARVIHQSASNATTAATKLLQSLSAQPPKNADNSIQNYLTDSRSYTTDTDSDNEADLLATVSPRFLAERNVNRINVTVADSSKFSASPCTRSLNLPLFPSVKGTEKPTPAVSRSYANSDKIGGLSLPPVAPPQPKPATDARKAKKVSSHQEDVHYLRLLHNHHLQWRFANAKAKASMQAQRRETERTLYSLGVKISELYDSVKRKRIELGILRRMNSLSTILGAQGEEVDILISELAKVTGGERALVEECGDLLSKIHAFQVEECSLRGQIMQMQQRLPDQVQHDTSDLSLKAVHMR